MTTTLSLSILSAGAPPAPRLRGDSRKLLTLFGGFVIIVILGAATWFLIHLHTMAFQNAEREMKNLSTVLAEQTARSLQSVELVLDVIEQLDPAGFVAGASGDAVHRLLREKIAGVPQIKYATVISADGKLLYSSFAYPTLDVWIGDRSYFTAHRDHPDLPLYISEPVKSRSTGEWLIFVSRGLKRADGSFAGVLTAALDPSYFENVYKAATLSKGMAISLLRRDGTLLVRYPHDETFIGRSFAARPLFQDPGTSASDAVHIIAGHDQRARLFVPSAVRGYPLIVTPTFKEALVFTDWWHEARLVGTAAAAATTAIIVLLVSLGRLFSRVTAANTALQASEESTRHQAETLSTLVDNLPLGVSLVGPDLRIMAFNRLFFQNTEFGPDDFKVGDSFEEFVRKLVQRTEHHPDEIEAEVKARVGHRLEHLKTGLPEQFESIQPDGRIIDIRTVPLPGGGFVTTRVDITERKKIEHQLIQAQKMKAIGNLTGGLAHDFNNLLSVVIGNLDLVRPLVEPIDDAKELVGEALDAAIRGAELTRRLLAFARRQPLRPERIEINELITGMVKLLGRTLGDDIAISLALAANASPVIADPSQLESAIINLATNARDAMPSGGRLTITSRNLRLDPANIHDHPEIPPGDYAMIEVIDTGCGMSPDVTAHIFEPFFTTKDRDKGTGLVFGFMRQSGGHIGVSSEEGVGTTFRLYLPRLPAGSLRPSRMPASDAVKGGGEKVLVVEDNAGLRRIAVRQLTDLGYSVAQAEDAAVAIAVLEDGAVDLLFTDVVLPGAANGYELAKSVLARWPGTRILMTSGFPDAKRGGEFGLANTLRLLSKPYRKNDLAQAVRAVLDTNFGEVGCARPGS
jgi:signal transduction histidine kinase/ActR/RegA family two-component response regulator